MVTWVGLSHIVPVVNGELGPKAMCGEERANGFKRLTPGNPVCSDCVKVALALLVRSKGRIYEQIQRDPAPHYDYAWSA